MDIKVSTFEAHSESDYACCRNCVIVCGDHKLLIPETAMDFLCDWWRDSKKGQLEPSISVEEYMPPDFTGSK